MTVPAQRARRRPSVPGRVIPLLLVTALLAPVAFLFVQASRLTDDDRDLAARERLGVQYLRTLGPVTEALVDAQSAAVNGQPLSRDSLTNAVEGAASVDARVGDQLRTHERWAGLRAKLEALPDRSLTDPEAAYLAYGEVTDLLLALHRKVRESSGLIRDPRSDSFFLQDGIAGDLPEAMVAAGRLADLATLTARRPAAERVRSLTELAAVRVAALGPATDLVADLRAAVDSSESTDLGPSVLTPLDTYQRAVETLAALSAPAGRTGATSAEPGQLGAARRNAQAAARQLQSVILDELDSLIGERIDGLDRDRWQALAAAGAAVVLLLLLAAALVAAFRRARRRAVEEARAEADPETLPGPDRWQPPLQRRSPQHPAEARSLQPAAASRGGETEPWGPFDAR
ncbi:hypothetical protein [Micromonospora mirobrigensis]|uniref:Nitrate and nitrite sensing n=1 Tax=Micromonospora mirobrigensis TaxID=262898 RepID=A0A1C4ZSH7_9ACTN|nr:hypothetical protein [Micromonospora mirobrigensis]SCF35963.1 hypothetical protein GA0070564_106269 [Micromonospora mirobrigensis]